MLQCALHEKLCFTLLLASLRLAQDTPKTMNRMHRAARTAPKSHKTTWPENRRPCYRAGSTYCRVEEAPIPSIIFARSKS